MKRIIFALLFAATLTLAYLGGSSPAQQFAPAKALQTTRIALVNYGVLFKCDKVQQFRDRIEKDAAPFKAKQQKLEKTLAEWTDILKNPGGRLKEANLARGRQIVVDCKRQLEDLEMNFKEQIGKRLENEMGKIWEEIHGTIKEFATQNRYDLVLGYGEKEKELPPLAAFRRRMEVIDAGGVVPAYVADGVDVSQALLSALNQSYRKAQPIDIDQGESR